MAIITIGLHSNNYIGILHLHASSLFLLYD
jgi:hypothetical protein